MMEAEIVMFGSANELGDDEYHVLRFDFDESYNPYLVLWDCDLRERLSFPVLNRRFNIEISNDKYCISTIYDDETPFSYCGEKLTKSHSKCEECHRLDYHSLCSICNGSKCLLEEERCVMPYVVYLALFGNVLKVGVSKSSRYPKRTIEQGADYSMIIANVPDGFLARRIEGQITNQFRTRDRMSISEKIKLLCTRGNQRILTVTANSIFADISRFNEYMETKQEILDLNCFRGSKGLSNIPLENKGDIINGRIVGSKGHILFIEDLNTISILNVGRVIGRMIRKSRIRIPTQSTLFSFPE